MEETTISIRTFHDAENNKYGVEVIVSGLTTQEQADRAAAFIQSTLCGDEKSVN